MNWSEIIKNLPPFGWFIVNLVVILIGAVFLGLYNLLKDKDIKIKGFEATEVQKKEIYRFEGKSLMDNQSSNARNLLRKIWMDLFETGKAHFNITEKNELFILEDICRLIESRLNYEIRSDFLRNHITEKSDLDLQKYSDAKATGYYRLVTASLYDFNIQLPNYYLPEIMTEISIDRYKQLFSEIYFSARKIAGGKGSGN